MNIASGVGGAGINPFLISSAFDVPVCRLGLASYGQTAITADDIHAALSRGVNYLNWAGLDEWQPEGDPFIPAIASLGAARSSVVICAQFGARDAAAAAVQLRSILATLKTDFIDLLTLYYVERNDEWERIIAPGGSLGYLQDAKRAGVVRKIGVTSHQRTLAAKMAKSGLLDAIMIRYNAAHCGAERDVFPVTQPLGLPVIAYTALRWGALLRSTPDDPAELSVPRPPAWYRFVLQQPAVTVTLAAPRTRAELDEDLQVLAASGPLADEEYADLAEHGRRVRKHSGAFR